jgi:hypothetical protein
MPASLRVRPESTEYAPFYAGYIAMVPEGDILTVLRDGGRELGTALGAIPESRAGFRYADGKWSIREMVGHMIDAERIFGYRALRFARGDATPVAGFDEQNYVHAAGSDTRTLADLTEELGIVRDGSTRMFASFADDVWTRRGTASGVEITVRAIAYITAGHVRHHLKILRERYLPTSSR